MTTVGFSGTRQGLTPAQVTALGDILANHIHPTRVRHGRAKGADAELARIVRSMFPSCWIIAHPCNLYWSQDVTAPADEVLTAEEPLVRNQHIVDGVDVMVICPQGMQEEQRSGTWATYRYARKVGKPLWVVYPDGSVREESAP